MRLVKFALPVLFAAGLALFAARAFADAADAAAQGLAREHARALFAQRAALVRAAPDAGRYREDLRALLRAWFADEAAIANRFPLLGAARIPFVPPPPPGARKGLLRDWQDLAALHVGSWREGKLPLLDTAASQGLRLDLLAVRAAPGSRLAVDVAVWGMPEEAQSGENQAGEEQRRVTVPLVFRGLSLRFFDAAGKVLARLDGQGEPALRLDLPERLVRDAPPGLVLGRYEVPLFPPGVAEVEWTLAVQLRSASGDPRVAQAVWRMKPEPAWSGAAWSPLDKVVAESEQEAKAAGPQPARAEEAPHKARLAVWPARE